ncbi:helix-turn-helix domain-containing protein [Streptomyces sp. NBC_01426]|uniref:ArsR/SmtB family transcription factor n=1 Tax=unclassified Streptomyces TaxID=2593676 RepID=UPI002E336A91|nr:helix-turn-helix domain-containing protein [Streptomyces sp. NBC_01426]
MPETNAQNPQPVEPVEPQVRMLDAHSLRGLAHPLRIRLLGALRLHGPATASRLAERLGESSGATSYHLRQLAAYGFVEDAPEHGKGRERWWRASHDGTGFDESLIHTADPETRVAADVFLAEIAKMHAQELAGWMNEAQNWSQDWRRGSDLSDFTLRLTADQSLELIHKLHDLINGYRDLPPSEGAETVRFHTHAFPRHTE